MSKEEKLEGEAAPAKLQNQHTVRAIATGCLGVCTSHPRVAVSRGALYAVVRPAVARVPGLLHFPVTKLRIQQGVATDRANLPILVPQQQAAAVTVAKWVLGLQWP